MEVTKESESSDVISSPLSSDMETDSEGKCPFLAGFSAEV